MKVHNLSIDSSQRQADVYLYANNYTVILENPIYDVTQIKLVSARIPTPQLTICASNKTFSVDGVDITLDETNYSDGNALAEDLELKLTPPTTNVDSVTFDSDTNALIFSNTLVGDNDFTFEFFDGTNGNQSTSSFLTTPHQVLGFGPNNYTSTSKVLTSGAINLSGPNALVLKLSSGSDEFNQSVYTSTPFYTGHILLDGSDFINFNGADDTLIHHFHTGPQKCIKYIQIEFFYMSNGRLIPYDFRNQEHILKFEITCSTDKLKNLPKVPIKEVEEKTPISIPKKQEEDPYKWKIYVGIVIVFGLVLIALMSTKSKTTYRVMAKTG